MKYNCVLRFRCITITWCNTTDIYSHFHALWMPPVMHLCLYIMKVLHGNEINQNGSTNHLFFTLCKWQKEYIICYQRNITITTFQYGWVGLVYYDFPLTVWWQRLHSLFAFRVLSLSRMICDCLCVSCSLDFRFRVYKECPGNSTLSVFDGVL